MRIGVELILPPEPCLNRSVMPTGFSSTRGEPVIHSPTRTYGNMSASCRPQARHSAQVCPLGSLRAQFGCMHAEPKSRALATSTGTDMKFASSAIGPCSAPREARTINIVSPALTPAEARHPGPYALDRRHCIRCMESRTIRQQSQVCHPGQGKARCRSQLLPMLLRSLVQRRS